MAKRHADAKQLPKRIVPRRIAIYVVITALLVPLLAPLSLIAHGALTGPAAVVAAVQLLLLTMWSRRAAVQIGLQRKMDVGAAPEVAAVLILPGPLALGIVAAGVLIIELRRPGHAVQRLFNTATASLRILAGLVAYTLLSHYGPAAVGELLGAMGAVLTMGTVATGLTMGISAVQLRENPLRRSYLPGRDSQIADLTLGVAGVLTALATRQVLWAPVLLALPLALAQRALSKAVALEVQTRLALEQVADIVDKRDRYTFEHSQRVAELSRATARKLGLSGSQVETITRAGRVHDVGKIGVKSSVLMKPGRLEEVEWLEMRSHPEVGAQLLKNFPDFAGGADLVLHHHERFDGKGYPHALKGDEIPLGARILAVADAWDAMTSSRAYRRAMDMERVYGEMGRGRGTQFDPVVLNAFLTILKERPDLAVPHAETVQQVDGTPIEETAA